MIKINLIPTKIRKKKEVNFELHLLVGTLLFSFLLIGGVYVKMTKDISRLRQETAVVREQVAAIQPVLEGIHVPRTGQERGIEEDRRHKQDKRG